jgi:hypothetical protein
LEYVYDLQQEQQQKSVAETLKSLAAASRVLHLPSTQVWFPAIHLFCGEGSTIHVASEEPFPGQFCLDAFETVEAAVAAVEKTVSELSALYESPSHVSPWRAVSLARILPVERFHSVLPVDVDVIIRVVKHGKMEVGEVGEVEDISNSSMPDPLSASPTLLPSADGTVLRRLLSRPDDAEALDASELRGALLQGCPAGKGVSVGCVCLLDRLLGSHIADTEKAKAEAETEGAASADRSSKEQRFIEWFSTTYVCVSHDAGALSKVVVDWLKFAHLGCLTDVPSWWVFAWAGCPISEGVVRVLDEQCPRAEDLLGTEGHPRGGVALCASCGVMRR